MSTSSIPEGCKPFDLERALAGDPVVTRDGRPVTQLTKFDAGHDGDPVYGVFNDNAGSWSVDGQHLTDRGTGLDLFMAPKKRTVWVNMCFDGKAYWYDSEEDADGWFGHDRIGNRAWPVEIEE